MVAQAQRVLGGRTFAFADQVFLGAVVLQGLHFIEHIAQVNQKFFLRLPEARGILGAAFDTEWVHFIYNFGLFALLWILVLAYELHNPEGWRSAPVWAAGALLFSAAAQSYHVVEHTVKLAQHLTTACEACPGLLGAAFDLVLLHFSINLLVMVPMVVALVGLVLGPDESGHRTQLAVQERR